MRKSIKMGVLLMAGAMHCAADAQSYYSRQKLDGLATKAEQQDPPPPPLGNCGALEKGFWVNGTNGGIWGTNRSISGKTNEEALAFALQYCRSFAGKGACEAAYDQRKPTVMLSVTLYKYGTSTRVERAGSNTGNTVYHATSCTAP